jgi:SsrA-binding protein
MAKRDSNNRRDICQNRRVRYDYFIEETIEAGIALKGTEVKALRLGRSNIQDAFCEERGGEIYLIHSYIEPFEKSKFFNHEARRPRKLLLHAKEIRKLIGTLNVKGKTIVPTCMYFTGKNIAKVEIAVVKGKKEYDKREQIKQDEWKRQKATLMKQSAQDLK